MKAIVRRSYGGLDVLEEAEVEVPAPEAGEALIKVYATSVNRSDWEGLTGKPLYTRIGGLFKPRKLILGSDMSGVVESVGRDVKKFKKGDEVFGNAMSGLGGFAQYACLDEAALIVKPKGITFAEAATLPQAASVALQAIRDKGKVKAGQHILINGAGGAVGSFAIQFAKSLNATITAVDSAQKRDFCIGLGANHFIDYAATDFTQSDNKFDFILDVLGNRSISDLSRALTQNGIYTVAGGRIFPTLILGSWASLTSKKSLTVFVWKPNTEDLQELADLCEKGSIRPAIDLIYSLSETGKAISAIGEGCAKGLGVVELVSGGSSQVN